MPYLTVYIKQADAELVKRAKAELGVSLASVFAEALKKKMTKKEKAKASQQNGAV